jgi:uncharacterized protein YqfB (UPF0267 family)
MGCCIAQRFKRASVPPVIKYCYMSVYRSGLVLAIHRTENDIFLCSVRVLQWMHFTE